MPRQLWPLVGYRLASRGLNESSHHLLKSQQTGEKPTKTSSASVNTKQQSRLKYSQSPSISFAGRADEPLRCLGRGSGSPQPVAMGVVEPPKWPPAEIGMPPPGHGRCGLARLRLALRPGGNARDDRAGRPGPAVADRRTNAPPRRTAVPVTLKTESPRELQAFRPQACRGWSALVLRLALSSYPTARDAVTVYAYHLREVSRPTRDWKAIPPALDINQPTISFPDGTGDQRPNPVTNGSSGVGPIPGIEP